MHMKVFALPFNEEQEGFDDRNLREFLRDKQVLSKSDYMFEKNGKVYLAVVVRYGATNDNGPKTGLHPLPSTADRLQPIQGSGKKFFSSSEGSPNPGDSGRPGPSVPFFPPSLNADQMALFERMRQWRYERARKQFIPAYMICSNKELEKIILLMPKTIEQLASIEGLSGTKVKNHGESMIEALSKIQLN